MNPALQSRILAPGDPQPSLQRKAPVFIVGSARSGTNLLYDMLLSSGGFAIYRTEPAVFDLLVPKFGDLSKQNNRARLLRVWLKSYQYYLSGLDRATIAEKILNECQSAGDFLRIVMDEIAHRQGVGRWAVWGPDNLLHIPAIASTMPSVLFIHMIRDGRDAALSLFKKGFIHPFPWDKKRSLMAAALHWKWKVESGRRFGRQIKDRYLEIRFEDLVLRPVKALDEIGRFLGHDFDYDQIQRRSMGTLTKPNSAYSGPDGRLTSEPVGRWKTHLSKSEIAQLESICGPLLEELGYPLEFPPARAKELPLKIMSKLYPAFFSLKEWMRLATPFGRFVSTYRLRFDAVPQ